MYNRYIAAALALARHSRERVKVVEDAVSRKYFTYEEVQDWYSSVMDAMPGNMPPHRKKENFARLINRTVAGEAVSHAAFALRSLKTAVVMGAKQYLLIDAGYDSFAYQQPDWAQKMEIFEINPLDIAMDKQARLTRAGISVAGNVNYVFADINRPGLAALLAGHPSFDRNRISFVQLGDAPCHMDRESFGRLLDEVAGIIPAGSSVIFSCRAADYCADGEMSAPCGELDMFMSRHGFHIYEQTDPQQLEEQFFTLFNYANIRTPLKAPEGICWVLAVKKGENVGL